MENNIEQMIKKAKAGDRKAFEELYKATYDRNYYIVFKMLNHEQDTLDVLQEAYIKIFMKIDQFTYMGPDSFSSWSGKIAANAAMDFLRKKKPILFTEMEQEREDGITEFDIEDPSQVHRPEIAYDKKETADIVEKLLNDLPEEQRICMILYYLQDMSIKEIAKLCNCSENTIKSRLYYGRKKIAEQGEEMQKQGILLMEIAPFTWLLYILRQEAAAAKAPALAWNLCQRVLDGAWIHSGTANGAGTVASVTGKGSLLTKIGAGRVLVMVATGSLGVGLGAGILIGRNMNISHTGTKQAVIEETGTTEESTEVTTGKITENNRTKKEIEKATQSHTTEGETKEPEKELTTEQETTAITQKDTEKTVTEEKTEPSTEKSTQKKTTATTEMDSVKWDDDYIEWDD
ncbi:MAG: RNA polymerase sigma factor [Lachnospiraceae bacterium]|nr:RNA polymerase sigma factor [Lachnospiraceae bacterium]